MSRGLTPSQTVGPFLHLGLVWDDGPEIVAEQTPGRLWIGGRVVDGAGDPIPDGLIETWQADAHGQYPASHATGPGDFRGLGRCPTGEDGRWAVRTIKPGGVPTRDGTLQAPHIAVGLLARGLLDRVVTRLYFPDEAEANAGDQVLGRLDAAERATLIARATGDGYALDLRLQGPDATVFFDV